MPFVRTNGAGDSNCTYKYHKCIIGVDQSYSRTGISISVDNKLKKVTSVDFKLVKTKYAKRKLLQEKLRKAIESCLKKYRSEEIAVVHERVRTFTSGADLRPDVIKAHTQLALYICDTATEYGIGTWSVDTRAWKSAVLGTAKPSVEIFPGVNNPQKILAVKKVIELGFKDSIENHKYRQHTVFYDDDAADSACISLYPFTQRPKLKREL